MPEAPWAGRTELPDGTTAARPAAGMALRSEAAVRPSRIRRQVVDRLTVACRRHIRHAAAQRRTKQPIGPHAILFFYAEPATGGSKGLRLASRLFLDGLDVTDLATVLAQLLDLSISYAENGGLDPRLQLCTRVETMTSAARYIGAGVSTLYSAVSPSPVPPGGAQPGLFAPTDASFRGIAALHDGTRLVIRGGGSANLLQIESTHTLDVGAAPMWPWRWAAPDYLHHERGLATISQTLTELHALIDGSPRQDPPMGHRRTAPPLRPPFAASGAPAGARHSQVGADGSARTQPSFRAVNR